MTYEEAQKLFNGSRWPFGSRYYDETFVEVELPVNILSPGPNLRIPEQVDEFADKYRNGETMDAVWLTMGRKMRDGSIQPWWNKKPQIKDGNHRITAAQKAGIEWINVIMPESHVELYRREYI